MAAGAKENRTIGAVYGSTKTSVCGPKGDHMSLKERQAYLDACAKVRAFGMEVVEKERVERIEKLEAVVKAAKTVMEFTVTRWVSIYRDLDEALAALEEKE